MVTKFILICENDECENYGLFVNEPEFLDSESAKKFESNFGYGSEEDEDFCPFCGKLATVEDIIEEFDANTISQ